MAVLQSPSESPCQNYAWNPTLWHFPIAYVHLFNLSELCNEIIIPWSSGQSNCKKQTYFSNAESCIFTSPAPCKSFFLSQEQVHDLSRHLYANVSFPMDFLLPQGKIMRILFSQQFHRLGTETCFHYLFCKVLKKFVKMCKHSYSQTYPCRQLERAENFQDGTKPMQ